MTDYKPKVASVAMGLALALSASPMTHADSGAEEVDRSPSALQARLEQAENSFKSGKLAEAVEQASSLSKLTDSSAFQSDTIAQAAAADLAVFQFKAGHPEETARLMRQLLLKLQLELPMDPKFATAPAQVLATAPAMLKEQFAKVIARLGEKSDTGTIIDLIIDNAAPKNYAAQLKTYCARIEAVMKELEPLRSIADAEQLKYGDPLTTLENDAKEMESDPKTSAANLSKIGTNLDALATQAQQMPVGDGRPALGLYTLALVANSAGRYEQAAKFAELAEQHINAVMDDSPMLKQIHVATGYALLKQGKTDEFKALKDVLAKSPDNNERMLVTLARFTEKSGDDAGAAAIYKRVLEKRGDSSNQPPPEWMHDYNELLKRLSQ
jgi:hypothetical protein